MTQRTCRSCGRESAPHEEPCPHCGFLADRGDAPIPGARHSSTRAAIGCTIVVALLLLGIWALYMSPRWRETPRRGGPRQTDVVVPQPITVLRDVPARFALGSTSDHVLHHVNHSDATA